MTLRKKTNPIMASQLSNTQNRGAIATVSLLSCCGIVPHGPHKSAARVRRVVPCRDHIYLRDARAGVPLLLPTNHDNWFVGDFAAFREVVFPHYLLHDKLSRRHLPLAQVRLIAEGIRSYKPGMLLRSITSLYSPGGR